MCPGDLGRDENYRLIQKARTDIEIAADLLDKEFLKPDATQPTRGPCECGRAVCKHCHPENVTQIDAIQSQARQALLRAIGTGLKEDVSKTLKEHAARLDTLWSDLQREHASPSFVDTLGIDRAELIQLLDLVAGTKPRFIENRVLKLTSIAEKHIAKLKMIIQTAEGYIESWSVRVMKVRRAESDILDKKTREKFKYKETQRILRCKKKIGQVTTRLKTWADDPVNYDRIPKTVHIPVTLREKLNLRMLEQLDVRQYEDDQEVCTVEKYLDILNPASNSLPDAKLWSNWTQFENELVTEAVNAGLINVSNLPETAPTEYHAESDQDEPDDAENVLILKTGGAQIGGSVYDFGTERGGQPRASGDFGRTVEFANNRRSSSDTSGRESDTSETADDSEAWTPD